MKKPEIRTMKALLTRVANPPMIPPIDLKHFIDHHSSAPFWYLAEFGAEHNNQTGFLCPVCGSPQVTIRNHPYWNATAVGPIVVDQDTGNAKNDDPQAFGKRGVSITMQCDKGHHWLFDIEQEAGGIVKMCMLVTDSGYKYMFPDAWQKWEGEDRDDEDA